jgi:hypothetical protein
MKFRHIVVAATTALLLTTGSAWAGPVQAKPLSCPTKGGHHKVPEINASNGISAIALLSGVLLLAAEGVRSRSRRA